ncbi:MAG: hypothetical protein IJH47_09490, partial [Oscillospiraceae bacterium]|nr:hypothetical protein [Oscillospiraceae bacterium]
VDNLSGTITGDADIVNHGDLTVDDLSVDGDLDLTVEGDLTGGDAAPGTANITADNADIHADGNVGSAGDPLETAVDEISVSGDDVDIHSIHDVTIDEITGSDITIGVDGEIYTGNSDMLVEGTDHTANIIGDNLTLDTTGGIAEEDDPLYVYIPGTLIVNNHTDDAYVINLFRKPGGSEQSRWNGLSATERLIREALGSVVFRQDWSNAPAFACELFRAPTNGSALTLTDSLGRRMVLRDILPGQCADGLIGGVFALNDERTGLTDEFRYLLLTAETRQLLLANDVRWVVFRVGDMVLLIDLSALEKDGDYVFALDPTGAGGLTPTAVWHDGEEILRWKDGGWTGSQAENLSTAVLLSGVTETFSI